MIQDLKKLISKKEKELAKIESQLDKCRTSVMQDGWQTQRYAKKSRKWDVLAQQKMKLIGEIDDLYGELKLKNSQSN